ncbi:transposase family protein [Streptomyces avermitilis]
MFVEGGTVHVTACTRDDLMVDCPGCGTAAHRFHSRYQRHLADTAVAGRPVVVDLSVRRLVCDRSTCLRRTFVEQVEGLTVRYGRRTPLLHRLLVAIALAPWCPWSVRAPASRTASWSSERRLSPDPPHATGDNYPVTRRAHQAGYANEISN